MEGYNNDIPDDGDIPDLEDLNFILEGNAQELNQPDDTNKHGKPSTEAAGSTGAEPWSPFTGQSPETVDDGNQRDTTQTERERLSPDEVMERANAMQERKQIEGEVMAVFGITPYSPSKNFERVVDTSRTAQLLKQIDDPEHKIDRDETFNSIKRAFTSKEAIEALAKDEKVSPAEARQMANAAVEQLDIIIPKLTENISAPDDIFKREVAVAEKIAQEEGVSFADVYRKTDLYSRSIRERHDNNPNTYVDRTFEVAEGTIKSTIDSLKEQGVLVDAGREFEVKKQIANLSRDATGMSFIRYWGSSELENLSPENLHALGFDHETLKYMRDKLSARGVDESQHADFIDRTVLSIAFEHNTCRNNGWDVNNLTQEQIDVIYQHPVMIDPLGQIRDR